MLHPDISAFIDLAEDASGGRAMPFHEQTPKQARELFEQTTRQLQWPAPQTPECVDLELPLRDGQVATMRLYRPHGAAQESDTGQQSRPVLVFLHGGGYVVGSLDSHDGICRELCAGTPCTVLSVGYRRAPEHKFPTALDDCADALAWLALNGARHGLDSDRVVFAGDSVGASLATVLATQAARQPSGVGAITPRLQLLCYPMTDASRRSTSMELFAEGYFLESDTLEWFYEHYARDERDRHDWRFSPLLTEDLSGVAPAFIVLAGFDPLLDEGRAYAHKLREQGVQVEMREYGGLTHDLLRLGSVADVSGIYEELCAVLQQAFAG